MSRHHILPPIIYTPLPKPKKAEPRRNAGRILGKRAAASEDVHDSEETGETSVFGETAPTAGTPSQDPSTSTEAAGRRIPSTTGKLSDGTLTAMLLAQEQESAPGIDEAAPPAKR